MRVLGLGFVLGLAALSAVGIASIPRQGQPQPRPSSPVVQPDSAGVVTGRVEDASGAALENVRVELRRERTTVQTASTNARGEFRFVRVAAGLYDVVASRDGLLSASLRVAVTSLPTPALRLALGIPIAKEIDSLAARRGQSGAGGGRGGTVGGVTAAMPVAPPPASAPSPIAVSRSAVGMADQRTSWPGGGFNTASYARIDENAFRRVLDEPVSTFSTDVDTASYANVRRFLNEGRLPPADAVRIEELINYFRFPYRSASSGAPLSITTEVAPCPWNPRHSLALVGLQARRDDREIPARTLVFLLDVSGSMMPADRLPLVKTAMRMLVDTLTAQDRVAVVVYAGASGLALPLTSGDRKGEIRQAIDRLEAGGSTNGAAGIQLAYDTAAAGFVKGGVNRVILATDGDFNVGVTSQGELTRLIERERERGIFLSVLGVGTDNLKDSTMEQLADRGNGNYAYLDSLLEARRVLIDEANSTLITVAKDVKIQIEFNPATVGAYRLIGYENRLLNRQDFNDDRKDAGEVGAGHTVTALYELVPPGEPVTGGSVDPLKYQTAPKSGGSSSRSGELMTVKVRYKQPDAETSQLMSVAVETRGEMTPNIGFAAAVAEFGMLLRQSTSKGEATWMSVQSLARAHRGADPEGHRAEFIRLVDLAAALDRPAGTPPVPSARR